jgi:hypothetical protein
VLPAFFVDFLTLEGGTERLSRNVGKELHYTLRKIPQACRSHLLRGGSLKSGVVYKQFSSLPRSTFLGALAKLRKSTISFVMSVHPSVRIEQLASNWTEFHKIRYLSIFRKSVEEIQIPLKSDKHNCTLREDYNRYKLFISFIVLACTVSWVLLL